jgi:hypothetical protein
MIVGSTKPRPLEAFAPIGAGPKGNVLSGDERLAAS